MKRYNSSFTGTGNPLTMAWELERRLDDTVRQVRDLVQR